MKNLFLNQHFTRLASSVVLFLSVASASAQRQMEHLGRGVVVLHSASSQAYIGWRLLVTDPDNVGFNVYRSANGGAWTKLNSSVITNTTDYLDTTASFTVSNAWRIVPVTNNVESTPSVAYGLAANSPVRQYLYWPLSTVTNGGAPAYDVKFCWVGDLDGDGEYDYVVDRLSTVMATNQFLQAYTRDGRCLWQMDMGPNSVYQYNIEPGASAISIGDKDNVTVYDLDGDGRAEVCVRTARGVVLPNGTTITGADDTTQYLSIFDGMTGKELARTTITNLWFGEGPMNFRFGIMYCDGVRPSLLLQGENRTGSGRFNQETMTFDFRHGQLTRRWFSTNELAWGHQIRIMDVNRDGIDDLINIGSATSGANGQVLWDTGLGHGDRFHMTDMDPEHPGLEMFAIQQDNPTLLATALINAYDGQMIKKWYMGAVGDVSRGVALDMDPNYRGCEMYSTQPGIFDCKGNQIWANNLWAPEGVWWDADLTREFEDGAGSGALNPVINKYNPTTHSADRLFSIYSNDGSYSTHQAYGGRAAFWGDLFGDWREELVLVQSDYAALRVYTTKIQATNRLYCLMQNPSYRCQATCKGYYQASYVDYYLGNDMPVPPVPPVSDAQYVWRGGASSTWDSATANWFTNNLWVSNNTAVACPANASVLFDMTGSNSSAITLLGNLAPSDVRVWSPKDYTFGGSGVLAGVMSLTKGGAGKLTLNGTNTYTGKTLVSEGLLIVNGSLSGSPVTVRGGVWLDGRLGGVGSVGSAVVLQEGAGVSPGQGTNSPGTLTVSNNVTFAGRCISDFDLSDNPTGATNDQLIISGNLVLKGTNTLSIHQLNATLQSGGVYPLIKYSGTLTGSLNNLLLAGLSGIPVALTNPPGQIKLVVKSYRAPADITWTGGAGGNAWDLLTSSNWLNGAAKDIFAPGDVVIFNDTGATNSTVTLAGDLNCAAVSVNSSSNYTFAGSGGIIGSASLAKYGSGTVTISTLNNAFTGKTILAGGTLIVPELDAIGFPGPLGNPPGGATNLYINSGGTLRIMGESYTDRGMTLSSGISSLDVNNSADQVTVAGLITGTSTLQKLGAGTLALSSSNSYSGGTIIKAGAITLGGDTANQYGLGSGSVSLEGGTLVMFSDSGSYNHTYWNLAVPNGSTGALYADDRCYLHGTLTGDGIFNFRVNYVRTELDGNWSAFTGRINVFTSDGGGDFRINNNAGYGNATVDFGSGIYAYHMSGSSVAIGALSGSAGATLSGTAWTVGAKNTNTIFGGVISGNSLTKIGASTLTLTGANTYTGATTIGGGTLLINGDNSAATGNVTVDFSGTLGGIGIVGGNTTVGGKLASGNNGIGTLTFNGNLTLNGSSMTLAEINKNTGARDLTVVAGTLTYGGTLVVSNLAGSLAAGDCFKLFDAAVYQGAFGSIQLPVLPGSLAWNTDSLNTAGAIAIVSTTPPAIGSITVGTGNFALAGAGGTPNADFYLLGTTNLNLPLTSWTRLLTNQFDASGNFNFTNALNPGWPQGYYRLEVP